jgi:hypothetical protein
MNSAAKIKIKTCSAFWGSIQTFEEDKRGHQLVKTRAKPENQKPLRKQSISFVMYGFKDMKESWYKT